MVVEDVVTGMIGIGGMVGIVARGMVGGNMGGFLVENGSLAGLVLVVIIGLNGGYSVVSGCE